MWQCRLTDKSRFAANTLAYSLAINTPKSQPKLIPGREIEKVRESESRLDENYYEHVQCCCREANVVPPDYESGELTIALLGQIVLDWVTIIDLNKIPIVRNSTVKRREAPVDCTLN